MTDNKWGGKREGAGRPKSKIQRKAYNFRLSDEELKAVKEVLAKMRNKLIIILFIISMLFTSTNAQTLQGNVEQNIDAIRQEAFEGVAKFCPFPNKEALQRSISIENLDDKNILSINQTSTKPQLIEVVYKDLPGFKYTYKYQKPTIGLIGGYQGFVVNVSYKTDKAINKIASYRVLTGKLLNITLNVSDNEAYAFDMDGNLLGYRSGNTVKQYKAKKETLKKHALIYSGQ